MSKDLSGLLISGSSHAGKSTLAASIGQKLRWEIISTDRLGRHPGRPWPEIRPHVAEFYSRLSSGAIYQFLLNHHENMWPGISRVITENSNKASPFILEGAALRPEYISTLTTDKIVTVFLYSDTDFLRDRMHRESRYAHLDKSHQAIIDKFVDRSLRDNSEMLVAARQHNVPCIDVRDTHAVKRICEDPMSLVSG